MKQYLVWNKISGTEADAITINAYTIKNAVERWAERCDEDAAKFLIVDGFDTVVMAKEIASEAEAVKFIVEGYSTPVYNARLAVEE